jgi:hypothetical protein
VAKSKINEYTKLIIETDKRKKQLDSWGHGVNQKKREELQIAYEKMMKNLHILEAEISRHGTKELM